MHYNVTIATVRPGAHPAALERLKDAPFARNLLACWFTDLGALNQIMMIGDIPAEALASANPLGIGDLIAGVTTDRYVSFDFMPPIAAGSHGPVYEVRTYLLKPGGLPKTIELWRKAVPGRAPLSPVLAAMYSVTGAVTRFMHIWPYSSLDERQRIRGKAVADGVWPPPGGPDHLAGQQADIYFAAPFSPMR
jgi:hypothetical protein